jgi:hypothetical protein
VFFAGIALVSYFFDSYNWYLLVGLGGVCVIIFIGSLKEKWRRKKEGYWVYKKGGADDGVLFYNERGQILRLYFSRGRDISYVPSDAKWKEIMPSWAKERKVQIISRVKQLIGKRIIGKNWTYEDTDNLNHVVLEQTQVSEK